MLYFSYDPNGLGLSYHDSADEAKAAAENAIEQERENCDDDPGWSENVNEICWGIVQEVATEGERKPDETGKHDYIVDYTLKEA
ncbi:MAG: hypothetical protein WC302_00885 [Candidatus Paceibacterota bacterium]|jgi:hypothetical protein